MIQLLESAVRNMLRNQPIITFIRPASLTLQDPRPGWCGFIHAVDRNFIHIREIGILNMAPSSTARHFSRKPDSTVGIASTLNFNSSHDAKQRPVSGF